MSQNPFGTPSDLTGAYAGRSSSNRTLESRITDMESQVNKPKDESKKTSPDRVPRRMPLLSPGMRRMGSGLRLVSPTDSDQELIDLEVASVLAEGSVEESACVSPTKSKRHETPFRPTTVMTNLQRGNVQTTTPLLKNMTFHQMAAQGELVLLQQEITEGVDVNRTDNSGMTALLWASANGQQSTVEFLLENGANPFMRGNHGENALLLASCNGFTEIVKCLLKLGLNVNYSDETGSSALMYASYKNHASCVKVLLEHGADITAQNEDNLTALDLAVGQGNKAVQQTIDRHMLALFDNLT